MVLVEILEREIKHYSSVDKKIMVLLCFYALVFVTTSKR